MQSWPQAFHMIFARIEIRAQIVAGNAGGLFDQQDMFGGEGACTTKPTRND